jgi:hypothetical protein
LLPITSSGWAEVTHVGYIFTFTDPVTKFTSGKTDIDFPANTARYFKVVIGEGDEGAVAISGATVYGDISVSSPTYTKKVPVSVYNNPDRKTTEITADLGSEGYLTHAITLEAADRNYNRRAVIEVSNDKTNWTYIGQGSISNIRTSLFEGFSNRIDYAEQNARYIRASIVNDDNQPIEIEGTATIEGPVISAIFETRPGETYSLYYGNPSANAPTYDIARIASYIEENKIPVATLAPEVVNSAYIAPKGPTVPFTESHKWLLNVLLVLVVFVIGFSVVVHLRNYKKDEYNKNIENKDNNFNSHE